MPQLNIKHRILVFVIIFEILAYSTILLFNNYLYREELGETKQHQIEQTFKTSTAAINHYSQLMEQNAKSLAIMGEEQYISQKIHQFDDPYLESQFKRLLINNFANFPEAIGGGIWYEPYTFKDSTQFYGPYAYHSGNDVHFSWDLSTQEYDYHNQQWYKLASNNWPSPNNKVLWTEPYLDEAGTHSLMMTVNAVMYSQSDQPIGIATVDWSLNELTQFLESIKLTENSWPFLIHAESNKLISFTFDAKKIMTQANLYKWGNLVLDAPRSFQVSLIPKVKIQNESYNIYFVTTPRGFIFGFLSPQSDIDKHLDAMSMLTLVSGSVIGAIFIIVMFFLMQFLFSPFDKVLQLIKRSIAHDDIGKVTVTPIVYDRDNEFTPIIFELNEVYEQITQYIKEVQISNERIVQSKLEIKQLNEDLEEKVKSRTQALKEKTEEALNSLFTLRETQQQLVEQEKHASLGRLVAGVSHEINTPLGISITAASLVEEELEHILSKIKLNALSKKEFEQRIEKIQESSSILKTNLTRTAELVRSFKQVAVDQSSEKNRTLIINDYIEDVLRALKPRVNQTKHSITFIPCSDQLELESNPGALAQIITNIIDNALIHGLSDKQPGAIIISATQVSEFVEIEISDNGKGMSQDVIDCIFDPFFTTARHSGGSGLGMHIVYNLVVQQLGGKIECLSEIGVGTRFKIFLPLIADCKG